MADKYFILNADNFGQSKSINKFVLNGYHNGFLKSASLCANGEAFDAAVNEIIPECPNLGVGVHLNISNGKSLTKAPLLTNSKGKFNKNFFQIYLKSFDKNFIEQVEFEFRTQIETIMNYTKIDHINSNNFVHAIPNIFKIVVKLAKEYNIQNIRTHYEEPYFVPYTLYNLPKVLILNGLTQINKEYINQFGLKTNNYILGIGYLIDNKTIEAGLKILDNENCIIEAIINPCSNHSSKFTEQSKELKDKITRLGFEITAYKDCK